MSETRLARQILISSIYCSQLKQAVADIHLFENNLTNYILAYTFLILTTETYLSGLFPCLLSWLSGKGRYIEIISHAKKNRKTLLLNNTDLLEGWYAEVAYNYLFSKKNWEKGQIANFFKIIDFPLSKKINDSLYNNYYSPLFEIRNALFHRDELVSGNFGPDSFVDKYFNLKKLNESIELAQGLINIVHKMIDNFIEKTDFEAKPKRPFAITSAKALKEVYENHQRSVQLLLKYKPLNYAL